MAPKFKWDSINPSLSVGLNDAHIKKIKVITADIRDPSSLIKASKGVDSLIHLAFLNGTEYFYKKPDLVLDIGVRGIINVIEACKKNEIKELI